jgi:hypothetical protein
LSFEKGYWQLTDSKSKFGTLLLVDEPIDLKQLKRQSNFQIGKTVVQINLKRSAEESGPCCGKYSPLKFPLLNITQEGERD